MIETWGLTPGQLGRIEASATRTPSTPPSETNSSRKLRASRFERGGVRRALLNLSDKVKLKKVTADNWDAVVELELGVGQGDQLASNLYSVAEAQFDPGPSARRQYREARHQLPDG